LLISLRFHRFDEHRGCRCSGPWNDDVALFAADALCCCSK